MSELRLQKILARAGLGSRRKCEAILAEGRVTVNGDAVTEPGSKADPEADDIRVDGAPVALEQKVVYAFNKPPGCVTTADDPQGRSTVFDFLSALPCRVFPVGRLDLDTGGLLILTNDGQLANRINHPSNKIFKTYEAWTDGVPDEADLDRLRAGVILDGRPTAPAGARVLKTEEREFAAKRSKAEKARRAECALLEIRIAEGRKRQVKRMAREIGLKVLALKRTRIGGLELGGLKPGELKELSEEEIDKIFSEEV